MPEVLRWAALAVPLVAALEMAFDNGGYFASTWGAWGAVLAGVLMLLAALVGTGVGGTPGRLAAAGLLGLAVWQAASAWWAEDGGVSQQVMGLTLVYATAIGIVMFALQDPRSLRWLSAGVLLVAVIPVAAAVGGRLLPGTVGHDTFARLTWPITYWNGLGALAAFTLVLAIGLGSGRSLPVPVRAAVLATMPLSGLALYLTLSRGAILVGLIAIVAMVALAPQRLNTVAVAALGPAGHRGGRGAGRAPGWPGVPGAAAARALLAGAHRGGVPGADDGGVRRGRRHRHRGPAADAGPHAPDRRHRRGRRRGAGTGCRVGHQGPRAEPVHLGPPPDQRLPELRVTRPQQRLRGEPPGGGRRQRALAELDRGLAPVETAPVVGTGAGDYRVVWNQHRPVDLTVVNAHSLYLETLGESGLLGLALLVLPMAVAVAVTPRAVRRLRGGPEARDIVVALVAAGFMAVHAAGDWDWQLPGVMLPAIVLGAAGLRASLAVEAPQGDGDGASAAPRDRRGRGGGAADVHHGGRLHRRAARPGAGPGAGHLAAALGLGPSALDLQSNLTDARLLEANVLADMGRATRPTWRSPRRCGPRRTTGRC
ncbi:MAG: hypothetical protein U0Y82_08515 [Thermoleophilia bacterium]